MTRVVKTDIQRVQDGVQRLIDNGQGEHIKHRHVQTERKDDHMIITISGKSGIVKLSNLGRKTVNLQPHWKSIEKCLRVIDSLLSDYEWMWLAEAYCILGLPYSDDEDEFEVVGDEKLIKKQFKLLINRHHPDKGGCPKLFNHIVSARDTALALILLDENFDEEMW